MLRGNACLCLEMLRKMIVFLLEREDKLGQLLKCWGERARSVPLGVISAGPTCRSTDPKVINRGQRANDGKSNVSWLLTLRSVKQAPTVYLSSSQICFPKENKSSSACVEAGKKISDFHGQNTLRGEEARRKGERRSIRKEIHHQVLHVFNEHISCKRNCLDWFFFLNCIKSDRNKNTQRCVAEVVLSYASLMKPQSHYKISQIKTALDHKHDKDGPPLPPHFTKNWPSVRSTTYACVSIYLYMYFFTLENSGALRTFKHAHE